MAGMAEEAEEAMPPAREGDCFRRRKDKETREMNVKNLGTETQRLRFERERKCLKINRQKRTSSRWYGKERWRARKKELERREVEGDIGRAEWKWVRKRRGGCE